MTARTLIAIALAALAAMTMSAGPAAAAATVAGQVVVHFDPGAGPRARADAREGADVTVAESLPLARTEVVETRSGQSVSDAIVDLNRRDDVAWAEPNYVVTAARVPNDPGFGDQWGLSNAGQLVTPVASPTPTVCGTVATGPAPLACPAVPFAGTAGDDIGAPRAWDTTTGSSGVLAGVIDTGIDGDHPDLAANVRRDLSADFSDPEGNGDPVVDGESHGTHVAGILAAEGDNGIGVAGVSWHTGLVSLRA